MSIADQTTPGFAVRRATANDAAACCVVLRRSITELCHLDHGGDSKLLARWLSNKTDDNVRRWIAQSNFFVAAEAERILGCAAITDAGKITLNYVAPEARFRGVSKALVGKLEETAQALGLTACTLETTQTALRFYEGLGYRLSAESYTMPLTGTPATVLRKLLRPETLAST